MQDFLDQSRTAVIVNVLILVDIMLVMVRNEVEAAALLDETEVRCICAHACTYMRTRAHTAATTPRIMVASAKTTSNAHNT